MNLFLYPSTPSAFSLPTGLPTAAGGWETWLSISGGRGRTGPSIQGTRNPLLPAIAGCSWLGTLYLLFRKTSEVMPDCPSPSLHRKVPSTASQTCNTGGGVGQGRLGAGHPMPVLQDGPSVCRTLIMNVWNSLPQDLGMVTSLDGFTRQMRLTHGGEEVYQGRLDRTSPSRGSKAAAWAQESLLPSHPACATMSPRTLD